MAEELDRLVENYDQELRRFVIKRISNRFDAEDTLQNIWIKVVKNQMKLADVKHVRGWLYQIARHTITDYYRKNKVQISDDFTVGSKAFDFEDEEVNLNVDCASYMLRELKNLPEKYHRPFRLYVEKGWKHKQISSELNLTLSGSKTRVQRAKKQLKEILLNCCDVEVDPYGNVVRCEKKSSCCA